MAAQKIYQHLDYIMLHVNLTSSGSLWAYTVQMVAIILTQTEQCQLSNFCLRVCFYLFHHHS